MLYIPSRHCFPTPFHPFSLLVPHFSCSRDLAQNIRFVKLCSSQAEERRTKQEVCELQLAEARFAPRQKQPRGIAVYRSIDPSTEVPIGLPIYPCIYRSLFLSIYLTCYQLIDHSCLHFYIYLIIRLSIDLPIRFIHLICLRILTILING